MSVMTPDAIQVAVDILRELGHEDMARWVEHPEAVRELLQMSCTAIAPDAVELALRAGPHDRACRIAAAWRILGDPRGTADIERAHEEALREQERRHRVRRVGIQLAPFHEVGGQLIHRSMLVPMGEVESGLPTPRSMPCDCAACEADASRSRQLGPYATMPARIVTLPDGTRAFRTDRELSDARGMEAVEDEARAQDRTGDWRAGQLLSVP